MQEQEANAVQEREANASENANEDDAIPLADDEDSSADEESIGASSDNETMDDGTNTAKLSEFQEYCEGHFEAFLPLTKEDIASIRLMDALRRKKAPLNAYSELLQWHLRESGVLREHETLKDTSRYHHRNTLLAKLMPRYNLEAMQPKVKKVRLPSSKAVVSIPYRDAADCIVSLLTDPRFDPKDYFFTKKNPFAPPPEQVTYLEDLNTGDAYLKTYEKLITRPNQVLVMVVLYMDGATTGQFSNLPVTALKISLGIHSREARDKDSAWREIAWIPQVRKAKARGKKLFKDSGHLEAQDVFVVDGEGGTDSDQEEEVDDGGVAVDPDAEDADMDTDVKAQDFHTMVAAALETLVQIQESGMLFDLAHNNVLYKDAELVFRVSHVKCDTEEGDLLSGKFLSRTRNVKQVCRYCHCPMDEADNPQAKYKLKTQASKHPELGGKGKTGAIEGNLPAIHQQCLVQGQVSRSK